jgi:hypothetical protein
LRDQHSLFISSPTRTHSIIEPVTLAWSFSR